VSSVPVEFGCGELGVLLGKPEDERHVYAAWDGVDAYLVGFGVGISPRLVGKAHRPDA